MVIYKSQVRSRLKLRLDFACGAIALNHQLPISAKRAFNTFDFPEDSVASQSQ
jgi:hypothetical protein